MENIENKEKQRKNYITTVSILIFINILMLVGIYRIIKVVALGESKTKTPYVDYTSNHVQYYDVDVANLKETLENKYKFKIYYGSSTAQYLSQVEAEAIDNREDIYAMLGNVENELNKYPKDFISEIQSKGYKVVLHLVDHFNNENLALANRTTSGVFNIYISNSKDVSKAMHHETYHILEYYMKLEKNNDDYYSAWTKYNPEDFEYAYTTKALTGKYVHGYDKTPNCSFVTVYSKYSETEDRAEVFSSMMVSQDTYTAPNILAKMKSISSALDNTFVCVNRQNVNYWERYIK